MHATDPQNTSQNAYRYISLYYCVGVFMQTPVLVVMHRYRPTGGTPFLSMSCHTKYHDPTTVKAAIGS